MLADYDRITISIFPERGFHDEGNSFHIVASTKNDAEDFARSIYGEYHSLKEVPDVVMAILKKIGETKEV